MTERLPHESLLSTSQFTLKRAFELLPRPETLSDTELVDLHTTLESCMSTIEAMGEAVTDELERRAAS